MFEANGPRGTVRGGQQVRDQAFRHCDGGGVTKLRNRRFFLREISIFAYDVMRRDETRKRAADVCDFEKKRKKKRERIEERHLFGI